MYEIYQLKKTGMGSNAYTTARHEDWQFIKIEEFEELAQAREYVYINTLNKNADFQNLMQQMRDSPDTTRTQIKEFVELFCFASNTPNVYWKYRTYWINPNIHYVKKAIISQLRLSGISAS
jgi:hypothetical protein